MESDRVECVSEEMDARVGQLLLGLRCVDMGDCFGDGWVGVVVYAENY